MENTFYKKYLIKDGLVEYKKDNETLLIEKPILDKSIKSIINKPVIITHDGENKVGEVVDAYYDIDTGNYIVGFNIWNEEAKKLLNNGYSISSTFEVINKEPATEKYHNIEYDNRVIDLEFINIAIVKEPRYQEAKQYVNSLDQDNIYENGGAGSGNWGHKGRKGLVGGSSKYGSEDYSEKDLSEIAKKKETKGIINKKSIIKETIKNKVMNKINNNKSLKERVEKFKQDNIVDKFDYNEENVRQLVKDMASPYGVGLGGSGWEHLQLELYKKKDFDKTNEIIQEILNQKKQEYTEIVNKQKEEKKQKEKQRKEEKLKQEQFIEDLKNLVAGKKEEKDYIEEQDLKELDEYIKNTNRKDFKFSTAENMLYKDIKKQFNLDDNFSVFGDKETTSKIFNYLGEEMPEYKEYLINKYSDELRKKEEYNKKSLELSKKQDELRKEGLYDAETREEIEEEQKTINNFFKKLNNRKDFITLESEKVGWQPTRETVVKHILLDLLNPLQDKIKNINKVVDNKNNQNLNKAIKEVKAKANETYKNNGYDIEKDNSSYYFKDMKKKAILKYGDNENVKSILNREFTEKDIPQNLLNYVKNSNGRLEANYWEGGDKKRIYFNVYDSNNKKVYFTTNTYKDLEKLDNGYTKEEIEKQRQKIKDLEENREKIINSSVNDMMEDADFSDFKHSSRSQARAERIAREEQEKRIENWIKNEKEKLEHMEDNM